MKKNNNNYNLNNELEKLGENLVKTLINGLSNIGKGNSKLAKSIKYKLSNQIVIIEMDNYGIFLDKGTAPHMPPVNAIKQWADARGINAWAVAMKIKRYGTRPQPFLFTIDSVIKKMDKDISNAGYKDFKEKTNNIFLKYFKNAKIEK